MTAHWFAIRTATRQEAKAASSLRELGLTVYLPQEVRWVRIGKRPDREKKQAPLFTGYLFALLGPDDIYFAEMAEGVHCVVGKGLTRQTVEPLKLASLALAESMGAFDQTWSATPEKWKPAKGANVKVVSGQYTGFIGSIVETRGKNRALLLVTLFGRQQKIERPLSELEAA